MPADETEYRIWSVANHKCLTLKRNNGILNVFCDGTGDETGTVAKGSSKVVRMEAKDTDPAIIGWRFRFTLGDNKYFLHVENDAVTAMKVPDNKAEPTKAAYFVPTATKPFEKWEVMPSGSYKGKRFVVVNADGSLSVKAVDDTCKECSQSATFVKIKECP